MQDDRVLALDNIDECRHGLDGLDFLAPAEHMAQVLVEWCGNFHTGPILLNLAGALEFTVLLLQLLQLLAIIATQTCAQSLIAL